MIDEVLEQGRRDGTLRAIDFHLGLFVEKLYRQSGANGSCPELRLAATLTSMAVGAGHVCLPLEYGEVMLPGATDLIPAPGEWREKLLATSLVGRPGEAVPLILDEKNRLYLYRYYKYEEIIAEKLGRRAGINLEYDQQQAGVMLSSLFPGSGADWEQKNAVALALRKPLVIISGGPGTGKTHTVARILAAILQIHDLDSKEGENNKQLRIALTAPTGKAAVRLEESIRKAKETIPAAITTKDMIPEQAKTLHRLLGYQPVNASFRYNAENLLYLDVVVLDEASMIDVILMAALVNALPDKTRIILLGDRNQLTSVEAGNLFSDLCVRGQSTVIHLNKSYRFHDKSGIGLLAKAVNDGAVARAEQVLGSGFADLDYKNPLEDRHTRGWLAEQIINGYAGMAIASSLADGFRYMEKFRILCAVRRGSCGTEELNRLVEQTLQRKGWLAAESGLYHGKPIIIRKNNYGLQLFNGDTGLLWTDKQGQLMAWFKRKDDSFIAVTPARLPKYDPGFAITIHQSQGSEFAEVLLVLPEDDNRVLSRELLYTGITRARNRLFLLSRRNILDRSISRQSERYSGLIDMVFR